MLLRLRNAVASMHQMTQHQERTANNLANVNTVGYKRDRLFVTALNERLDIEDAPVSDRLIEQQADLTAGSVQQTGNPLDLALRGKGFFEIQDEATGELRYTRAGAFITDDTGMLRTPEGEFVMGTEGPLTIPTSNLPLEVGADGTLRQGALPLGTLRVVAFEDPSVLERASASTFTAAGAVPVEAEAPDVLQGFLEMSNVNAVNEMTDMIAQFRAYESQQKSIQTVDALLGQLVRDTGKF